MPDLEDTVSRILASYTAAIYKKDVNAFIRLYDPKVRIFDAWGVWSYEGTESWRIAVEGWFSSLGTEKVKAEFEDVQTAGSSDFAAVSTIVTYAGFSTHGAQLRSMQNRLSWVLKTSSHVLRIIHEHTSAPIGFEDRKAILQRKVNS